MKSNNVVFGALLFGFALLLAGGQPQQTPEATARKALDLLLSSQFEDFRGMLSPEAKDRLTLELLRNRVASEIAGFGKMQEIGRPVSEQSGPRTLYSFPVRFANTTVNIQFTINESGTVGGLFFRSPDEPLPPVWARPAYSKPTEFHEREITIGSDEWKLPGTLTLPNGKGPFPGVVLIHGAGPNDRDESVYATRMFADIAEGLASRGIAVLRYEKRTRTYGPQMSAMSYTLKDETIEDAVRALSLLRSQPEIDPGEIFALGHSLGGYSLPRVARQYGKLKGAILLAANARPIQEVSIAQTEFMLKAKGGPTQAEARRLQLMKDEAARVHSLADAKDTSPVLLGLPVAYYVDLADYDPVAEAHRLALPCLILQGERDFQVTSADDFTRWNAGLAGDKNITLRTYPALNHLFISGDGPPSPAEYRKAGNVAPAVIDDISVWVLQFKHN